MWRLLVAVSAVVLLQAGVARAQDTGAVRTESSTGTTNSMDNVSFATAAVTSPVENKAYQAEKTTRSVQKLADGTVITHETHGLVARSATGQVREDVHSNINGIVNGRMMDRDSTMATVADPVTSSITLWQTGPAEKTKTAIVMQLPNLAGLKAKTHLQGGIMGGIGSGPVTLTNANGTPLHVNAPTAPKAISGMNADEKNPNKVTHEDLGQQSLEGLLVTGKRTTTVIPLDKIGNDRPITVIDEVWTAPELGIVVKQIDSDPRTGERTMELTGVTKTDPDAALFHPPADYKVQDMAQIMKSIGDLGKTPAADEKK